MRPDATISRIQKPAPSCEGLAAMLPKMSAVPTRPIRRTAAAEARSSTHAIARGGLARAKSRALSRSFSLVGKAGGSIADR